MIKQLLTNYNPLKKYVDELNSFLNIENEMDFTPKKTKNSIVSEKTKNSIIPKKSDEEFYGQIKKLMEEFKENKAS